LTGSCQGSFPGRSTVTVEQSQKNENLTGKDERCVTSIIHYPFLAIHKLYLIYIFIHLYKYIFPVLQDVDFLQIIQAMCFVT
jgi:hypothetical protein